MIVKTISFEQKITVAPDRVVSISYSSNQGAYKGLFTIKEIFGGYRQRQAVDGTVSREQTVAFDCDYEQLAAIMELLQEAKKQKELEKMEELL